MSQGKEIKVTVDNEQTKILAEELARERLKNERLVDTLARREIQGDNSDLATRKLQVYQKFGDSKALDCQTTEELRDLVTSLINERAPNPTPAGSAPLNSAQYGQSDDLYKRRFPDQKSMIDALLADMHGSDPRKAEIARSYYDKMLAIWIKSKRSKQGLDDFFDPNRVENLPLLKDVNGFKVPVDPSEGDIGRLQKMWRAERTRKAQEGAIQQ